MSVHVSSWVWDYAECEGNELLIMLALADYANDEGVCWPGMLSLAKRCRCTVRTAQRAIGRAVGRCDLRVTARLKDEGDPDTHLYEFVKYAKERSSRRRSGVVTNLRGVVTN